MREIIHKIHLWAGLAVCLPLVLLGLTGSILVFDHEIEDLFAAPHALAAGTPHSVEEILNAARKAAPEGFTPTMFRPGTGEKPATVFLTGRPRGKGLLKSGEAGPRMQVAVDPASLTVTPKPPGFMRQILQFHSSLLLREYGGRSVVGWFGAAMLVFGITGVVLWWPRPGQWRTAFILRPGSRGWLFHRELHGAVGIWSLLVLIVVTASGVYLAFPRTMDAVMTGTLGTRDLRAPPAIEIVPDKTITLLNADEAIDMARKTIPEARLSALTIPAKPSQPYRISLLYRNADDGTPPVNVFIDPWKRQIIEIRDPRDYSPAETVMAWTHAVHAGHAWGWTWRMLVFMSGLLPLLFSITGISMWAIKRR
ncbi:MAG: PepSY-associated TM helix domain-containing protein [Bdellovibrionales bacterium]